MDKITEFTKRYINNCEKCCEMDASIMQNNPFHEWIKLLTERSIQLRKIFVENEQLLKELQIQLEEPICDENALLLYEAIEKLYYGGYDDLYVMETMATPLLFYYEEKQEFEKLVFLYHMLAFENFEFYERMLGNQELSRCINYFHKVISFQEKYTQIKDIKIRTCILKAYNNLISPVGQLNAELKKNIFHVYDEVMHLWNLPAVQELDGQDEDALSCIHQIQEDILFVEDYVLEMSRPFQLRFLEIVEIMKRKAMEENLTDDEGTLRRAELKCKIILGGSPRTAIQEMIEYINGLDSPDYSGDEWKCMLRIMDFHNSACTVFELFNYANITMQEQKEYMKQFASRVTDVHMHVPFGFWTTVMSNLCAEWFKEANLHIDNLDEKKQLLFKLVISRQPITYIHSLMVQEISLRIAESMLENQIDFFDSISFDQFHISYPTKREKILAFVGDCALLHDIGKCELSEVINRQSRFLSDNEFAVIKCHPKQSFSLLKEDSAFQDYYDVMVGHHKSYDGNSGYPEDFDTLQSPIKPIIDLIMISDCIDAATDMLGRNYARGKTFAVVMEELKEGAGTRYNPIIIHHIATNQELYHNLENLTQYARQDVYYRAYEEILRR